MNSVICDVAVHLRCRNKKYIYDYTEVGIAFSDKLLIVRGKMPLLPADHGIYYDACGVDELMTLSEFKK